MFNGYSEITLANETIDVNSFVDSIYKSNDNIIILKKLIFNENVEEIMKQVNLTQAFVASEIQNKIESIFQNDELKWNIYIYFLANYPISYHLINEIESNKFCCKKYLVNVQDFDYETIKNAVIEQIPLFAKFEIADTQAAASSDAIIKEKIFQQSNKTPLARKFLEKHDIEQILDPTDINQFLDSLEQEEQ
jgi:hypothetical protein